MQALPATKFKGVGRLVTGEVFINKNLCPEASSVEKALKKEKEGPALLKSRDVVRQNPKEEGGEASSWGRLQTWKSGGRFGNASCVEHWK